MPQNLITFSLAQCRQKVFKMLQKCTRMHRFALQIEKKNLSGESAQPLSHTHPQWRVRHPPTLTHLGLSATTSPPKNGRTNVKLLPTRLSKPDQR